MTTSLRPLHENFFFEFLNETYGGRFVERNKSPIVLLNMDDEAQSKYARWGRVYAVSDEVTEFGVGDFVLIEAKMWTTAFEFEGTKIWKSDVNKVCAIGADESVTFAF